MNDDAGADELEEGCFCISEPERMMVVGALDTLGVALAEHKHRWTDGERAIYELACEALGIDRPPR